MSIVVVVMALPDLFREIRAQRNSTETQQPGHAQGLDQRSKMEEVVTKMTAGEAWMRAIQKEVSQILQFMTAGAARRILLYPA